MTREEVEVRIHVGFIHIIFPCNFIAYFPCTGVTLNELFSIMMRVI